MPQRAKQKKKHKQNKNRKRRIPNKKRKSAPVSASNLHKFNQKSMHKSKAKTNDNDDNSNGIKPITSDEVDRVVGNLDSTQSASISRHKMSKALKYQFDRLAENSNFDYIFVGKRMDYGVSFSNPMGKTFFRICQNKATETAEERSIGMMFQMLYEMAGQYNDYNVTDLKKQLFMEYGKNVDWNRYIK
eukprot:147555_1